MHTVDMLSAADHRHALIRRRIRFVLSYPAMARLFRKGVHDELESLLVERLQPEAFLKLQTEAEYEQWLERTVEECGVTVAL